jgi:hypothetical protein
MNNLYRVELKDDELKPFWKILPIFLLEVISKHLCERYVDHRTKEIYVQPFKNVRIIIE